MYIYVCIAENLNGGQHVNLPVDEVKMSEPRLLKLLPLNTKGEAGWGEGRISKDVRGLAN